MQIGYQGRKNSLCFQHTDLTTYLFSRYGTDATVNQRQLLDQVQLEDCGTSGVQVLWDNRTHVANSRSLHYSPTGPGTNTDNLLLLVLHTFLPLMLLFNIYSAVKLDWRTFHSCPLLVQFDSISIYFYQGYIFFLLWATTLNEGPWWNINIAPNIKTWGYIIF